ncbi:hypothetical protein CRUP_037337 [Coryphaenoides rupestris]|nr:hypothetical protein CRUP_037337 [Coryphaenoides rupestris]
MFLAALMVFFMSIATVMGPTPPGTGRQLDQEAVDQDHAEVGPPVAGGDPVLHVHPGLLADLSC